MSFEAYFYLIDEEGNVLGTMTNPLHVEQLDEEPEGE